MTIAEHCVGQFPGDVDKEQTGQHQFRRKAKCQQGVADSNMKRKKLLASTTIE
jgi:hypothetical protein